jgi:hypothetical protein
MLKTRLKKILSITLSLILILALSSCNKTSNISTIESTETAIPVTEYKTIPPPEDGWTLELLNEVTYINGNDIDLPFCLNDLGEDFTVDDLQYSADRTRCLGYIYYKGKKAIRFLAQDVAAEFSGQDKIQYFDFNILDNESNLDFSKFITINGVNSNSNVNEVILGFGDSYHLTEIISDMYSYYLGDEIKELRFSFTLNNNNNEKYLTGLLLNLQEELNNEE